MNNLYDNVKKRIDEIYDEIVNIRRELHKNPELSNLEFNTNKLIRRFLDENNINNKTIVKTGVIAEIINSKEYKTVAIRSDIDALPIKEKNTFSYKSQNEGVMHACGHDVHTAILLGSAKILNELKEVYKGNIKFFFQPAEETTGGALPMINKGVLKNPNVDYIIGLHVMPYIENGKIELKYGKLNASSDNIKISIIGKRGHGAYPESGIDAIVIMSHILTQIQTIVSRNISPLNSSVISFGKISGGDAPNVICENVSIEGTIRTLDIETRNFVKKRIYEIVENTSKAFNAKSEIIINEGYEPLINDDYVTSIVEKTAKEILNENSIIYKEYPSLGVEDFSFFSNRVKGAFFHLGCKKNDLITTLHSDNFDIDENCIKTGILMEVITTLKLLNNNI